MLKDLTRPQGHQRKQPAKAGVVPAMAASDHWRCGRERHMRQFKSVRRAVFLATHSSIHSHFRLRRHRLSASGYRAARGRAFNSWRDATGVFPPGGLI